MNWAVRVLKRLMIASCFVNEGYLNMYKYEYCQENCIIMINKHMYLHIIIFNDSQLEKDRTIVILQYNDGYIYCGC